MLDKVDGVYMRREGVARIGMLHIQNFACVKQHIRTELQIAFNKQ